MANAALNTNLSIFQQIKDFDTIGFRWFIDAMNRLVYEANEDRWDEYLVLPKFDNAKELRSALTELGRVEPPMPKIDPNNYSISFINYD